MIDTPPAPATPRDAEGIDHAHVRDLYALIYSRVGNREAAEALTSQVVARALTDLALLQDEHRIAAGLSGLARTAATDYWRQEDMRKEECITRTQPAAVDATRRDHAERARVLLDRLPETDRTVLSHRIVEGASVAETARRMGIGEAQVKVVQQRALTHAAQLRKGALTATQRIATDTQESDHDAPVHSRSILCRVTPA